MVYDAARQRRDDATTAEHERLVQATGVRRILSRAQNGELVSYLPEEYGNGRKSIGPTITTARGYIVFVSILSVFFVILVAVLGVQRLDPTPEFEQPAWVWLMPLLWLGVVALFARYMVIEIRADRLRKERGLPVPSLSPY